MDPVKRTLQTKQIWWVRPDLNWGLGAQSRAKLKQTAELVRRAQREARIGPSTTAASILKRVALGLEGRLVAGSACCEVDVSGWRLNLHVQNRRISSLENGT
jgi:hypothetical protein